MNEFKYHIYLRDNCIYHSLSEKEFHDTWSTLNKLVSVIGNVSKKDISYEKVLFTNDLTQNASY